MTMIDITAWEKNARNGQRWQEYQKGHPTGQFVVVV